MEGIPELIGSIFIYAFTLLSLIIWRFRYVLTKAQVMWVSSFLILAACIALLSCEYNGDLESFFLDFVQFGWAPAVVGIMITLTLLSNKYTSDRNSDANP